MQNRSLCPWTFSACHVSFLGILYKVRRDKDRQPYATRTNPTSGLAIALVQGFHRHTESSSWRRDVEVASAAGANPLYHCQAPCDALRVTEVVWGRLLSSPAFSLGVLSKYCWRRDAASPPSGDQRWLGRKRRASHDLERPPGCAPMIGLAQRCEGGPTTGACVVGLHWPVLVWLTMAQARARRGTPSAKTCVRGGRYAERDPACRHYRQGKSYLRQLFRHLPRRDGGNPPPRPGPVAGPAARPRGVAAQSSPGRRAPAVYTARHSRLLGLCAAVHTVRQLFHRCGEPVGAQPPVPDCGACANHRQC